MMLQLKMLHISWKSKNRYKKKETQARRIPLSLCCLFAGLDLSNAYKTRPAYPIFVTTYLINTTIFFTGPGLEAAIKPPPNEPIRVLPLD
jgi:hypothetical protein